MSETAQPNAIAGRTAFIAVLKDEGVTQMFGNPGTTELPIMHALTDFPEMHYTLALQEALVVAMADGYARASGELVSCNVHVAPGLGNAMGSLFAAWNTGTPMILTAGQQEQGHGLMEPLLFGPLVEMARPCSKWAIEVTRLEDLPMILRRAAKIATTEPTGPVFISLPGDILNDAGPIDLGQSTRVDTSARPSDATLRRLAERLLAAKAPVLLAGHEIVAADAFWQTARLAEALGAPVYQQTVAQGAHFPSEHPAYMGQLSRAQPRVRQLLEPYDTLVCIGADVLRMSVYSPVDPLPPHTAVVQIGQRDWEMGKNQAAELAVRADVRETLEALVPLIQEIGGEALRTRAKASLDALAGRNWTAQKAKSVAEVKAKRDASPMDPRWLMMRIAEMAPENAILVDDGVQTTSQIVDFYPYRDRYAFFGNNSGGIGWAIAASVGIQMARPERKVIGVIGDGSAMYSIQALWTAANQKLPMVFVIANNAGYRIIKQRLKLFHGNEQYIGMDFNDPYIDQAGLARAFGMEGHRVETADEFDRRFAEALVAKGPVLLDCVIDPSF